jgi:hypothetical protein
MARKKDSGIREVDGVEGGKAEGQPDSGKPVPVPVPPVVNQELENKLKEPSAVAEEQPKKGRGRPLGSTKKPPVVEAVQLPNEANPIYTGFLQAIFKLLAKKMNEPEMEISEFEAESLSLPMTQIIAYHFPNTSPIALAYLQLGMAVTVISMSKAEVVAEWQKKKELSKKIIVKVKEELKIPPQDQPPAVQQ